MSSTLYKHDSYLDRNSELIIGSPIYEYDMSSAGYNICKYYKLLPDDKIDYLESLSKRQRQIELGLIQKKDKEFKTTLKEGFKNARKMLFESNDLSDNDILSIKKDAIFTLKPCKYTEFDNIIFGNKNTYTSFMLLRNIQLFYNKDRVDVKGIHDDKVKLHRDGILQIIYQTMNQLESMNIERLKSLICDVCEIYKAKELPIEYYREFNANSCYRYNIDDGILFDDIGDIDMIDISYNYMNVMMMMVNILI